MHTVPAESQSSSCPTGPPVISPRWTLPILVTAGACMVVGEELSNPPWSQVRVGSLILKLVPSLMGIVMPGWRR